MRGATLLLLPVAVLAVAGCGGGGVVGATPARRSNPDEEVTQALADAVKLIRQDRLVDAEQRLAGARPTATLDPDLLERLDYYLATVMVYNGELLRAQKLLAAHAQQAARRGDADSEAWMQSSSAWLRWAAGDHLGAAAENERISRILGGESDIDAIDRRALLLSQLWDRAFFLVDHAASVDEVQRADAMARADEARGEFEALAREPENHETIVLLGAYFAARRGEAAAAARAVNELPPDASTDARWLYVQIVVLESAGETAAAAALRARLKGRITLLTPLLLRALDGGRTVSGPSSSAS
jgi:hypothetical protein